MHFTQCNLMRVRGSTPTCVRMVSENPRNMNLGVYVEEGSCLEGGRETIFRYCKQIFLQKKEERILDYYYLECKQLFTRRGKIRQGFFNLKWDLSLLEYKHRGKNSKSLRKILGYSADFSINSGPSADLKHQKGIREGLYLLNQRQMVCH